MKIPKITMKNVSLLLDDTTSSKRLFLLKKKHTNNDSMLGVKIHSNKNILKNEILKNINIELQAGDSLGVIGHNGCGKTTLLRVLSSIYQPTSGQISICGKTASFLEVGSSLNPEANGRDNIEIICRLLKKYDFSEKDIETVESISELGDYLYLPVKNYSAGMLSRLLFSTIIINKKEIMVFDEGLIVGDSFFIKKSKNLILNLVKESKINIFASHDMNFIRETCNRVAVMKRGNLKNFNSSKEGIEYYQSKEYLNW